MIAIDDLVIWTYHVQAAHRAREGADYGRGSVDLLEQALQLGAVIRTTGPGSMRVSVDPVSADALIVHGAVLKLAPECMAIVFRHGKRATVPDWLRDDILRYEPVYWVERKRSNSRKVATRRDPESGGMFCPIRAVNRPGHVMQSRLEYSLWRGSLIRLREMLKGRLSGFEPGPPNAARDPWRLRVRDKALAFTR